MFLRIKLIKHVLTIDLVYSSSSKSNSTISTTSVISLIRHFCHCWSSRFAAWTVRWL